MNVSNRYKYKYVAHNICAPIWIRENWKYLDRGKEQQSKEIRRKENNCINNEKKRQPRALFHFGCFQKSNSMLYQYDYCVRLFKSDHLRLDTIWQTRLKNLCF